MTIAVRLCRNHVALHHAAVTVLVAETAAKLAGDRQRELAFERRERSGGGQPVGFRNGQGGEFMACASGARLRRGAPSRLRPPAFSSAAISSFRLLALPASSSERFCSAPSAVSCSPCRRRFSATSKLEPLLFGKLLAEGPGQPRAVRPRSRRRCATVRQGRRRAPPFPCASSGTTAPSRIALRTEASASSGVTRMAGGGLSPMRCSAPSTSASTLAAAGERLPDARLPAPSAPRRGR